MRIRFFTILVAAVLMTVLLSACGPAAKVAQDASTITAGQSLPAAPRDSNNTKAQPASPAGGSVAQVTQPGAAPAHTISVTGSGRTFLTPDMAYVNIGVHTESTDVGEALATNEVQAQKVADAIKALGVDPKDIQTTNFSIYPQSQPGPNGETKPTGFAVDNSVYVTVRSLDKLSSLLDAAVKAGANTINGVQFDVSDRTSALSDARKSAVQDASKQAQELASAAGVQLGSILSISTATNATVIPMYGMGGGGGMAAPAASVPVSPGQMTISVDVTMTYEIK